MCTKINWVNGWGTKAKSTIWGRVYLYDKLIGEAAFKFGIQLTDK